MTVAKQRIGRLVLAMAIAGLGAAASSPAAMTDKVDPTKRATLPSGQAIEPSATVLPASAFSNPRIIRLDRLKVQAAGVQDKRATVDVGETRAKNVLRPPVRSPEVRVEGGTNLNPGRLPASVPRLDRRRFQEMLGDYEAGRRPADLPMNLVVEVNGRQVDIGVINRFASPRAALDAQGIPVIEAGSGEGTDAPQKPADKPAQ